MYNTILVNPLMNLLVIFYNFLGSDLGLAIIALTLLIRLLLYPSFKHQLQAQKRLSDVQPQLNAIKERHKDNKEQQSKALMEFYKTNKVNPFSSCLPLIIQLVILIALYRVFYSGLNGAALQGLYPFVKNPGTIHTFALGFLELSKPNVYLAVITGAIQYFQSKMMMDLQPKPPANPSSKEDIAAATTAQMSKSMVYIFPIITIWIGSTLPAGLTLYWFVTTLFSIGQQYLIITGNKPANLNPV